MAQELDQAQRRRYVTLPDDLGRVWESTLDILSQGPCAPINPKGWIDPLGTPQAVLIRALQTNSDTGRLALALKESYALWRDNLKQKAKEYETRLLNDAMMLFGQEGPRAYEDRSPTLLAYTGGGPQAWEPIEAALQGNSAALGRKPLASDPRVAKYFIKPEPVVPSFTDESLDAYADIEEAMDPDVIGSQGGKTQLVKGGKQKAPPKVLVEV